MPSNKYLSTYYYNSYSASTYYYNSHSASTYYYNSHSASTYYYNSHSASTYYYNSHYASTYYNSHYASIWKMYILCNLVRIAHHCDIFLKNTLNSKSKATYSPMCRWMIILWAF